jgi:hypothetical protein
MIATSSDLARLTVHHCPTIVASDEYGDALGPTSCGIVAGTYGTTQPDLVTCADCIGAMIDSLFTPNTNHQEMTR